MSEKKPCLLVDFLPTSSFLFLSKAYLICTSELKLIPTSLVSTRLDQQHIYPNRIGKSSNLQLYN